MGRLVKLIGAGIGFTSEAIQASRSSSSSTQPPSSSRSAPQNYDQLPAYEGATRGATFDVMKEKHEKDDSKAAETGHDSESDSSDSDQREVYDQDEGEWELDEMAEQMRPPSYKEFEASPMNQTEEVRMNEEEQMMRGLVQMAGPSRPAQRLPCAVIIPQRRPRKRQYGFVRAFAPVLADCGVSQEVFLQFLTDWEKASNVSD